LKPPEQLRSGEGLARVLGQPRQQLELHPLQGERRAGPGDPVAVQVDLQIGRPREAGLAHAALDAAQNGPHSALDYRSPAEMELAFAEQQT
jgi:hypothetical protein